MNPKIKFVHTNIVARDWQKLARFYIEVFGCEPRYPERDFSGEWVDRVTGLKDVNIKGIHLKLPGYEKGPTLEIFEYNLKSHPTSKVRINGPGLAHIAFHVEDMESVLNAIKKHGGNQVGDLVEQEIEGIGTIKVVYARDVEGNIVELQHWKFISK
jgi:predicted enzyme related to lactoylglutathione lyase